MRILGIDPGPEQSAYVVFDVEENYIVDKKHLNNEELCCEIRDGCVCESEALAIEEMECMGMPVGKEVFKSVLWSGRFIEAFKCVSYSFMLIPRRAVKMHLCNSMRAKDANIRQALIDRFGGKEKAIGNKRSPGKLWGISNHLWSALAIAVTAADKINPQKDSQ